jgi:hypothetical protein
MNACGMIFKFIEILLDIEETLRLNLTHELARLLLLCADF